MNVVLPRPHAASGVELYESAVTVPYSAGMASQTIKLVRGSFTVVGPRREPVLLVRLRRSLADEAVVVRLTVGGEDQPVVVFSPFSAEGTMLPGFRPELVDGSDGSGDFTVDARVHRVTGVGRLAARPSPLGDSFDPALAADMVEAVVLEGRFARLLYLATLEKQRCIRHAREVAAVRHRELAHGGALDARGLDLGVPRILDEDDNHYRARLAIYSRWRMATPAQFAEALNGPGADSDANAGLTSLVGVNGRFRIVEEINELSIATRIVSVGGEGATQRTNFHQLLRSNHLVDLDSAANTLLPEPRRKFLESVRRVLREELTRAAVDRPRYLAPLVAVSLDSAVRLMRALGHTAAIELVRAYDPAGGSRYELGLGVDLAPLTPAQLAGMADEVDDLANGNDDDDLTILAQALEPRPASEDPAGRWLFQPCGFRTVHFLETGGVHLSPLPTQGQWIDGPADVAVGASAVFESRYHSGGAATGVHVLAREAAVDTADLLTAEGFGPPPPVLSPTALRATLDALAAAAASQPPPASLGAMVASGVVSVDTKALAGQLLTNFNLDQIVAFSFPEATIHALGAGPALRDAMVARIDCMTRAGFYSTRAVWDAADARLLVLASVSTLPGAATKSGEPPPATFYWYETRLPDVVAGMDDPLLFDQRRGGKATVRSGRMGLSLLVCVGYARRGLADPFEVRVEAMDDSMVLSMDQYGYLMNLLEFLYPIGIEINTFDIRRNHTDADGDGQPEFLTSRASRTYHRYQHRRPFGSGQARGMRGAQS